MNAKHLYVLIPIFGLCSLALPLRALALGIGNAAEIPTSTAFSFPTLPKTWDGKHANQSDRPAEKDSPKSPEEMRAQTINATVFSAHELVRENKTREALEKLDELNSIAGKTDAELFIIERTRLAIASLTIDTPLLLKSAQAVVATGKAEPKEQLDLENLLARSYYNQRNYAEAIPWMKRYFRESGSDEALRLALIKSYYFSGSYANALTEAQSDIQADERAGKTPSEDLLKLSFSAASKLNDQVEYVQTLEKLTTYYPRVDYWSDLLNRTVSKSDFSPYYSFEAYRLMFATGQISSADDYVEMAQLALQAGYPAEAKAVLDKGYNTGVLGQGTAASAHKHLRDLAASGAVAESREIEKRMASLAKKKNGDMMVDLGYRLVTHGVPEQGVPLMEQGLCAGGLTHSDEAKLHLGIAYSITGHRKEAVQLFNSVQGKDGASDLARYWTIYLDGKDKAKAGISPVALH